MKKLLILIVAAAGGWVVYQNWDSLVDKPTTDDYAMDQYKKSVDKAREVEEKLEKTRERMKVY